MKILLWVEIRNTEQWGTVPPTDEPLVLSRLLDRQARFEGLQLFDDFVD